MFHARAHANTEVPTTGSAETPHVRPVLDTSAEQLARTSSRSKRGAAHHRTAGRGVGGRLGLILLVLAAVMAFGAVLVGTAAASSQRVATHVHQPLTRPEPSPATAAIRAAASQASTPSQAYTVAYNDTASTVRGEPVPIAVMDNDIAPDRSTLRVVARPEHGTAVVQLDGSIVYTPKPRFVGDDRFRYDYCRGVILYAARQSDCPSATVTVTVWRPPAISSVRPDPALPATEVEVRGNTGSCIPRATLTAPEMPGVSVDVTGDDDHDFLARLTVPKGTLQGAYLLELRADCDGTLQQAKGTLTVIRRQTPVPVDDTASTLQNTPVKVPVTANDLAPDVARLQVTRRPAGDRTATVQGDGSILYTPDKAFVGDDRFQYDYCGGVALNRQADCPAATVTVTVMRPPSISSVRPGHTPPNRRVEVRGDTGSCNRRATLIFHGDADVRQPVRGNQQGAFVATVPVARATLPGAYTLELQVDCHGEPQQAEGTLTVVNHAPVARDDRASTRQDTPVVIPVTANDSDPDGDDGYPTVLLVASPPAHGTATVRPDGASIRYTSDRGFGGKDRFTYSLCDDIVGSTAGGGRDCGTATVTVDVVTPATTTTPAGAGGTGTPGVVPAAPLVPPVPVPPVPPVPVPTVTLPPPANCVPATSDVRGLHVSPGKGPRGAQVHITAEVDRRFVACGLRLLLGGSSLGGAAIVRPDGSVSEDRPVPGDAKPGISPVGLATTGDQLLAEAPFEVVATVARNPWVRLGIAAGAVLIGALAHAAIRRLRARPEPDRREAEQVLQDVRAEPRSGPVRVTVDQDAGTEPTFTIRLQPHDDDVGTQTLKEVA